MFSELSAELYTFFSTNSDFNEVMTRDGKTFLFPIMASEGNALPLTTYVLGTRTVYTKDRDQIEVTVNFWFDKDSYDACCSFTDEMCDQIESAYNFISSEINFNENALTYYGQITFNLI